MIRIIIEASERQGKTTLAREIADRLRMFGINVEVEDEDIYEPNDQPLDAISVEHTHKMCGVAQYSEKNPVVVTTRLTPLEEVDGYSNVFSQHVYDMKS